LRQEIFASSRYKEGYSVHEPPAGHFSEILARKAEEIAERSANEDIRALTQRCAGLPMPRGFVAAIEQRIAAACRR